MTCLGDLIAEFQAISRNPPSMSFQHLAVGGQGQTSSLSDQLVIGPLESPD